MAWKKIGSLDPHGGPVLRTEELGDSVQAVIGRPMGTTDGVTLVLVSAGSLIYGHIEGIVLNNGMTPIANGNAGDFTQFYLTAATNSDVAKVKAVCDISKFALYSADSDATLGTTQGSNRLGYHTDLINGEETDESSAVTTTAQWFIHGADPADSTNQVINIFESMVFGV